MHGQKQTHKQTTQDNRYQPIPPKGASAIARGMGLLKQKRECKINSQRAQNLQKDSDNSVDCEH